MCIEERAKLACLLMQMIPVPCPLPLSSAFSITKVLHSYTLALAVITVKKEKNICQKHVPLVKLVHLHQAIGIAA
jgi:hypothetical protein